MSLKTLGGWISTTQMSQKEAAQRFKLHENMLLLAVKIQVIIFNAPTVESLRAKIYSVRNGLPIVELASSYNSFDLAEMCAQNSGLVELYFNFSEPHGIKLNGQEEYCLVLGADTYVGNDGSHLAWKRAWPDNIYSLNYTPSIENAGVSPYHLAFIGANP